jgi:RNA polymerase sigma factor (sigma-70 family)
MEAARTSAPLATDGASAPRYLLKLAADAKLVGRVRGGSEQAFAVLYERHHRGILSFCRHMLGSREEAEDAVQQTFANAYRAMVGSTSELNLKPWLYRIARNQCISTLRARRHESELTDDEPSLAGLSDQVAQRDQLRDLLRDLAALPVEQREALVLAELHDNSHVEVAAILGCEREKVKSLVFQARSSLISSRQARELPCEEIRRQLSTLRGGALRRNPIRRHLKECEGCRAFRAEVKHQRQAMAVLLPVIPSAALKLGAANAMAAAGVKAASVAMGAGAGAAGAAAGGGSAAGAAGPAAALASKLGVSVAAVKTGAATVAVTVAAGGGAVAVKERSDTSRDARPSPIEQATGDRSPGGGKGPGGAAGAGALVPGAIADRAGERDQKSRERRRAKRNAARDRERRARGGVPQGTDSGRPGAKRQAAKERRLERRRLRLERREQRKAEDRPRKRRPRKLRRRPAAVKPAPRVQPPAGTSSPDPPPTKRPPAEGGPTFPAR